MKYTVYKVTNKISGKFYIGTHKTTNLDDNYMGSGKYLKYSIAKHGVDNFDKVILHVFDTPEEMYAKEAEIVTEDFIAETNTYNLKVGGFGGFDHINRTKSKSDIIATSRKGGLTPAANPDKLSENISIGLKNAHKRGCYDHVEFQYFKGKNHTDETKAKISAANKGKRKGKDNSQYGTCWIHNNNVSRKIEKDYLEEYLIEGWIKGRRI